MNLNLSFAIPILAIITMALFYAYMQNNYSIGIFFAMMMVVFIQPTNLLVSQAAYRIFGTAIGAIISFVVGMFILPNSQENNLSILLAKKISLSKDLMVHILTRESKKSLKDQKLIHKNNLVISSSIDRISEEYVNIDKDIDLIIELSSSLNQIKGNFLSLNRYINSTDKDFEFEKAINLFDNFYSKLNNAILEGEVMDFDEEFECYGGELEMINHAFTINPSRGTAIVFPSNQYFINRTVTPEYGDMFQMRFHVSCVDRMKYSPADYRGNYSTWFKGLT